MKVTFLSFIFRLLFDCVSQTRAPKKILGRLALHFMAVLLLLMTLIFLFMTLHAALEVWLHETWIVNLAMAGCFLLLAGICLWGATSCKHKKCDKQNGFSDLQQLWQAFIEGYHAPDSPTKSSTSSQTSSKQPD